MTVPAAPSTGADHGGVMTALPAAAMTSFLAIIACISYPAVVFSGELEPLLPAGIGIAFLSAAILGLVIAATSTYPGSIAYAQSEPAVILGIIAASMATRLREAGRPEQILPTILAAIAIGSLLCGSFVVFLGTFRLGNLIRYIPFPVMGGFLAGIGWLLGKAALSSMAGVRMLPANALDFLGPELAAKWLPGVVAGAVLWILQRYRRSAANMAAVLGGLTLLFWVVAWSTGQSPEALRASGWLLGPFPEAGLWTWRQPLDTVMGAGWSIFPGFLAEYATLMVLTATALLLTANGIEIATQRDLDLNRELRVIGIANIVGGLAGAQPGYHSLSGSVLSHRMNTPRRIVGVLTALACLAALLFGAHLLGFLPKVVVGALLAYIAIGFLDEWLIATSRRMALADYSVLVLVFAAVVAVGFMQAIALGTAAGIGLFVVRYSRIGVARDILSGATYRSNVDRAESSRAILHDHGDAIYILKLQGFMFFGTSNELVSIARARFEDTARPPLRYLICDFRLVNGIDASVAASFIKLAQYAASREFRLVLTNMPPPVDALLRREGVSEGAMPKVRVFPDLDHGLEWAEDELLAQLGAASPGLADSFETQLRALYPDPAVAAPVRACFARVSYLAGERLIEQGELSQDILFIESGRVAVIQDVPGSAALRLKSMGAGTVVGEISFYVAGPRSASVVALEPTIAYLLSGDAMRRMQREHPQQASEFHAFMAKTLALKLVETNRLVGALNS